MEAEARAAHRLGARSERRRTAQRAPVRRGGRTAGALQHPLAERPRQEPGRVRTRERQAPHAQREDQRTKAGGASVSETVLDCIVERVIASREAYDRNVQEPPIAL